MPQWAISPALDKFNHPSLEEMKQRAQAAQWGATGENDTVDLTVSGKEVTSWAFKFSHQVHRECMHALCTLNGQCLPFRLGHQNLGPAAGAWLWGQMGQSP